MFLLDFCLLCFAPVLFFCFFESFVTQGIILIMYVSPSVLCKHTIVFLSRRDLIILYGSAWYSLAKLQGSVSHFFQIKTK
jgi:hypothetical protein